MCALVWSSVNQREFFPHIGPLWRQVLAAKNQRHRFSFDMSSTQPQNHSACIFISSYLFILSHPPALRTPENRQLVFLHFMYVALVVCRTPKPELFFVLKTNTKGFQKATAGSVTLAKKKSLWYSTIASNSTADQNTHTAPHSTAQHSTKRPKAVLHNNPQPHTAPHPTAAHCIAQQRTAFTCTVVSNQSEGA